jgi:hypothetical protein
MSLPPLLASRGVPVKVLLTIVAPIALGSVTGVVLGVTEGGYLVLDGVATLGGFAAGLEHRRAREAMARGLLGGTCFGGSILVAHAISARPALASIPEPAALLLVFTITGGVVLGALGAALRARLESRARRRRPVSSRPRDPYGERA